MYRVLFMFFIVHTNICTVYLDYCIIMWNYMVAFSRNLVSASQDGKLIVWDGYTTNKVWQ